MKYRAVLTRKIIGVDYVIMSAMTYVRIEVHFTVRKVINDEKNSTLTITGEPKFENTLTKEQSATAKRLSQFIKVKVVVLMQ